MSSFLKDLVELSTPAPCSSSIEQEEIDELTGAKVVEEAAENEDLLDAGVSQLRLRTAPRLDEIDPKYRGLPIPRSQVFQQIHEGESGSGEELEEEEEEGMEEELHEKVEEEPMESEQKAIKIASAESLEQKHKGEAVRHQLGVWDQLMGVRIRLQKLLLFANRLPTDPIFHQDKAVHSKLSKCQGKFKKCLDSLLDVQEDWFSGSPELAPIVGRRPKEMAESPGENDEEEDIHSSNEEEMDDEEPVGKKARKRNWGDYPKLLHTRHEAYKKYRDEVLLKWYQKTRLASGKIGRKGFDSLETNVLTQIEQILSNKERLFARTRVKRSEYFIFGMEEEPDSAAFDDDDFYQQLLRELIDRKGANSNDPMAISRRWVEMERMQRKAKKKMVDTRASKGRKVRFEVHPKLVNFCAAETDAAPWSEARTQLFRSLFGKKLISDDPDVILD